MKKTIVYTLIIASLALPTGLAAQGNEIDAYTLSNTELSGTARSMSMGGAFGALGGDISVISSNPAGLGIYRSSDFSGTIDFSSIQTKTRWYDQSVNRGKNPTSLSNLGFEIYIPSSSEGVNNWNFGFSYNRVKNFTRRYRMSNNGQNYSIADYVAWRATNAFGKNEGISERLFKDNPYSNDYLSGHWLPVLGYESGSFGNMLGGKDEYQSAFGYWENDNTVWTIESPSRADLVVNESGHLDEYNIGIGTNVSDLFFFGASLSVTDINYRYNSAYEEHFSSGNQKEDDLYLENSLTTEGTGLSLNLGAIVNLQSVRLGVAYNTPREYWLTDFYGAQMATNIQGYDEPKMSSQTPEATYSEYCFQTPGKWIFSGAVILGRAGLISVDYELSDYSKMLYDNRGDAPDRYFTANDHIKDDYTLEHTFKVGAEVKPTPQLAIRAGYIMQSTPMRKQLINNEMEVYPSGTIPHFATIANPTVYYTAGIGYRFNPNFYMDLAYVYRLNKAQAYAFSNTGYDNPVKSVPASLKTTSTRLALTLGYKF